MTSPQVPLRNRSRSSLLTKAVLGLGFALIAAIAVYALPSGSRSALHRAFSSKRPPAAAVSAAAPVPPQRSGGGSLLTVRSAIRSLQSGDPGSTPATPGRAGSVRPQSLAVLSRLDQVGHLDQPIPGSDLAAWRREIHAGISRGMNGTDGISRERAALLHLWLGEWELAGHEAPIEADRHFRQAQHLLSRTDRVWGAAAYDRGLVQFAEGDYDNARALYGALLSRTSGAGLRGFSRANAAMWLRHASACYGYHAQLGLLGIPRPPRLDPLCGAGGLAACLRAMHRPYDKATILKACRVTGRGSNALDLLTACPKLGVVGRFVTADDAGLKQLPKPCISYVEHDHFVTVLRADADGVAYLCTDCGAWPGGEVRLDWKQWHALEATGYITVTRNGSLAESRLAALAVSPLGGAGANAGVSAARTASPKTSGVQVASASRTMAFAAPAASTESTESTAAARLAAAHHIAVLAVRKQGVYGIYNPQDAWLISVTCGFNPQTLQCLCVQCCATDSIGADAAIRHSDKIYPLPTPGRQPFSNSLIPIAPPHPPYADGNVPAPSRGDPVNLATLEEEYEPGADLAVYNPHGPSVHWHRTYQTLRGNDPAYEYDDFGSGWSHGYDFAVYDAAPAGTSAPTNSSQVPQAGSANSVPVTGTTAPASSANVWEIYDGSTLVASSTTWNLQGVAAGGSPQPTPLNGWTVSTTDSGSPPVLKFAITAPAAAQIGTAYTVRAALSSGSGGGSGGAGMCDYAPAAPAALRRQTTYASATFSVVSPPLAPAASGTKYLVFPNGSRISFTNSAVPSAGTPTVSCSVQRGAPYLVSLCYDPNDSTDYYTVTFADQTTLRTAGGFVRHGNTLYYPIGSLSDRVGNRIDFAYSGVAGLTSGLPILTQITDDSTGSALLTITRSGSTGQIASVADCYGRSVYYSTSWHASSNIASGFPSGQYELDQVSQIVATGASSPAMRWQLGYILSSNTENSEKVNFLHTITTPSPASPTGSGTATATINYDTEYGCFVASITDANGNIHQYLPVDGNHTQVVVKNTAGTVVYAHTVGFDSNMSQTTDTDGQVNTSSGANTHVMYTKAFSDPNDPYRPSSLTDAAGRVTSYTWDTYGHLQSVTDTRGTVTTDTWDYTHFPLGRLTAVQVGSKPATSASYYEPSGLIASVTAPAPSGSAATTVTASATYDSLGNLLTVTGPGNNAASTVTTTLGYTSDSGGYSQSEGLGRPITVTDNLGHTSHTRYDTHWRTSSSWDALGNEWDAAYNIADQMLTVTAPATGQSGTGRSYTQALYAYPGGATGKVRAYNESGAQIREVDYSYGAEGEGLSVSGSCENVSFSYDALYRVLTLSDGNSHTTTWSYGNAAGFVSQVTYPDGNSAYQTSYDATGRLLQFVDQNGLTANYSYGDSAGDLTSISYTGHSDQNVTLSYDGYGRTTNTTDAQSSYACTYGNQDETVTGTRTYTGLPARTITFTYNPDGSRNSLQLPVAPSGYSNANCYSYSYDAGQRLTGITDNLGNTSTFSYANNNWLLGQNSANGLTAAFTRNALGQGTDLLNSFTSGGGTTTGVSEFSAFGYDGVGNLTSVTASIAASSSLSGSLTFAYDSKDQLTSETNSAPGASVSNSFAYDSAGNATTFRGATRSFNSANEFSGTGFVYDSAGNPTTYNGSICTFDVFNRATSLGTYLTAGYRSDGMRAWKQDSSGNRTYFLYDGDSPLVEMDSSGNYKGEFLYGPAGLISHNRASLGTVFFAYDDGGDVQSVFSSTGSLISTRAYDAYGAQTGGIVASATYDDPEIGYDGQSGYITDPETNLVLCGHRYYDPAAGRWLNRDPIGYSGGIGLYNYCDNNPVMDVDTSGLMPIPVGLGGSGRAPMDGPPGDGGSGGGIDWGGVGRYICDEILPDMALGLAIADGGPEEGLEEQASMAEAEAAVTAEAKGGTYTLHGPESGNVMRTGQTSNLAVREAAHKRKYPDLRFQVDRRIDDYATRRGREHIIEERYQPILAGQRAIRLNHPLRDEYIQKGSAVP